MGTQTAISYFDVVTMGTQTAPDGLRDALAIARSELEAAREEVIGCFRPLDPAEVVLGQYSREGPISLWTKKCPMFKVSGINVRLPGFFDKKAPSSHNLLAKFEV